MVKPSISKTACVLLLLCVAVALPAQTFTSLLSFDGIDGSLPEYMSLRQGTDANLYGMTSSGGTGGGGVGAGTLFKITQAGVLKTLYNFCSQVGCPDGAFPEGALLLGSDGNFYGVTNQGGTHGSGTIFRITPAGDITTLYSFCSQENCSDGAYPYAGLFEGIDGKFYGTTAEGGAENLGTVFSLTRTGTLTTLHTFDGPDGSSPLAGLIQATDGWFYGVTWLGGDLSCNYGNGCGTVFRLSPSGTLSTLHVFEGSDGEGPAGTLVHARDGSFYGTTYTGGSTTYGTVFKITRTGDFTMLHNFNSSEGGTPFAGLIQATDDDFYGTNTGGGNILACGGGCGTVFKITAEGVVTALHIFDFTDGATPYGGLLQDTTGGIYGTTGLGGSSPNCAGNCGTIFSIDMGLGPFVTFIRAAGRVGQTGGILGQGFTGTTSVMLNGLPATFKVVSDTFLAATVPSGATTGSVSVTTPSGVLKSNVPFRVIP